MTADEFLLALAVELGTPQPTAAERELLLEVAAVAAHSSERLAAPLACWMCGVSGRPLKDLLPAAQFAAAMAG